MASAGVLWSVHACAFHHSGSVTDSIASVIRFALRV